MKKIPFLLLLFIPLFWCKKDIPKTNNTEEGSPKSIPPDRKNTSAGYELRGKELDSINYYRKKAGEPTIDVIIVDTVNNFSQLYYEENGIIKCEVVF